MWAANTIAETTDPHIASEVDIVIVHNGTAPVMYINGVLSPLVFSNETDKTAWFKAVLTDATNDADAVTVGSDMSNGGLVNPLTGDVVWIKIYDRVLSPIDVRELRERD